jgi:predicted nucleic acid-binding protein
MMAADASSLVAYLQGLTGADLTLLDNVVASGQLVLPPVVVTQVLSGAQSARTLRTTLPKVEQLRIRIDHDVPLITRDGDFRHFAKHCGLKLA